MGGTAKQLLPHLLEAVRVNVGMEVSFMSRFANGRREFLYVSADGSQEARHREEVTP